MKPNVKPDAHHPTTEELFAYRDGELSADQRTLIEAHVLACAKCRELINQVSALESDLRMLPDAVGEEYYERMTESVLARVAAPGGSAETAPLAAERTPHVDRRRADAAAAGGDERRRLRLPWIGIAGTGAAAVAVVLVAVVLLHRPEEWVRAPRPVAVKESGKKAKSRAAEREAALAKKRPRGKAEGTPAAGAADELGAPARKDQLAAGKEKKVAGAKPSEGAAPSEKPSAIAQRPSPGAENAMGDQAAPAEGNAKMRVTTREAVPSAPALLRAESAETAARPPSDQAPGEAYARVLRDHGLPVMWDEGVPPDALLRAESALRLVYQTHRAGADSARIRLYLAEAERARLGTPADPASIDHIANHYRRAISLARGDAALAAVARRRLADLLLSRPPASQEPSTP